MLKTTFPLLTLLLFEATKTESQQAVAISNVQINSVPEHTENVQEGNTITLTCSANIVISPGLPSQISYIFYKKSNNVFLLQNVTSDKQKSQYTIQPTRASHSGSYYCVVEVGSRNEKSEITFITVTGKLQRPVLVINPMMLTVGNSAELGCKISGEIPPFTFIFYKYKKGQPFRLSDIKDTNENVAKYLLKVAANTEEDYSCTVQGNDKETISNYSEIVHITVQDPFSDPTFTIEPSNGIFEGDQLAIKCTVEHTSLIHDVPQLTIVKGTTPIKTIEDFAAEFSQTATSNDTGDYKCNAKWNDALKSTNRQVTVAVPVSKPTLKSTPTDGNLVKGHVLALSCAVLKGSYPITYKFYKEASGAPLHQVMLNATEAVHHINSEHNGKYFCEASNTANQKTRKEKSQFITVTVKVPVSNPTIKLNSLNIKYATGERVTLHCHSTNGTTPINYSLFLNRRLIYSVTRSNTEPAAFNVLINETKDGGEYKCKAENEIPNSSKYSEGISFTVKGTRWWIYGVIAFILLVVIAISVIALCWYKNNKDKNQEDESYKTHQGPLRHNHASLKGSRRDIYSKVVKMTRPRLNQTDSGTLIQLAGAYSDSDHKEVYTNFMASNGNVTGANSESDCEGDYTNVTSKRNAANADIDSCSDEHPEILYTELDLAALQNNVLQSPESTTYAEIALVKLRDS
uniref:platelet endothelial cell adhesion molecule-like isoform X2 n=1 Tax=Pristiophorus japonicus TaxID=55135 RepID=UPI00398F86C0